MSLSARHERFCQEYVIDLNATAAYRRAGYKARGHAAEAGASRLLRNDEVQKRIAELQAEIAERLRKTALDVMDEVDRVAFAHLGMYASWSQEGGVVFKDSGDLTAAQLAAVREIREEVTEIPQKDGPPIVKRRRWIKLHDKNNALDLSAKLKGAFPEKGADDGGGIQVIVRGAEGDTESYSTSQNHGRAVGRRSLGAARRPDKRNR
jgi:phage terminase small subunit